MLLFMVIVIICGGHGGGWFRGNRVYVSRMAEADRRFMVAAGDMQARWHSYNWSAQTCTGIFDRICEYYDGMV